MEALQVGRSRSGSIRIVVAVVASLLAALLPPPVEAAAPLVSPSGAGTVVIGPQAMEGNLQIYPGDSLRAGFDFTMPGSHPAATASFYNGYVSLLVKCADGSTPALTIQLPSRTITDPAGSPSWFPSGDQSSSLVYQGSLTAPNLCAGGVMNDASGALFTTTFFSTDTIDKVNFRFHYSDNTSGSWSATVAGVPTPFAKTVTSATLTPTLSLGLTGDHATAIPGDTITYTATATNTGATLQVGGDFMASDTGTATATVASYWDDIQTSIDGTSWTPLVGAAATASGYTPAVGPPSASGLTLSLTSVAATGVTYPTSGDPILGTSLAAGSTAQWHYTATATLSATQAASLFDPTKVKKIRNSFHLEVSPANPNVAQPAIANLDFSNLFFSGGASASLTNLAIGIQPPQGSAIQFNSTTTPALASLASGASTSVSGTYKVPAPPAKASGQTDSAYFSALSALEGSLLKATASASATATTGTVNAAPPPAVVTVEHLPIVSITKSGPSTINAGTTETNPLALSNSGGAAASALAVTDSVPNGANGTVTGVPATLAAGTSASASAAYPVPGAQAAGNLTDTAALTWQDTNGNSYGPVSSSFTTTVANPFAGATLTLSPTSAGPNAPGTSQSLTATLLDSNKQPISGQPITFAVTGANPTSGSGLTDANGNATFTYTGANIGTDTVQATFSAPATALTSNTSTISWTKLLQTAATTIVQGNFFINSANSCTFDVGSGATPVFSQSFPDILFNPDPSVVPHDISNIGNFTRPFTDLTVDVNGNYNGQIVAQGNGQQAGVGSLENFYAEFTGTFVVNQPGDLTFTINHDDGYIFGVGNGATRVNGDLTNNPATTPFNGYGVVAAWNVSSTGSSSSGPATVHFPAAGTYPYELDYTECSSGPLFLQLLTSQFTAQTSPLSIYVGYADGLRPGGSIFPFPWNGSPNVTFVGGGGSDDGALRFDNSGTAPIVFDSVTVDIGPYHYDLWPRNMSLAAGQILILTATSGDNFDTSDTPITCTPTGYIPQVHVSIGGVVTTFKDTTQILNTGGIDVGVCTGNESRSWTRIGGGGSTINVPTAPAATLDISPFNVQNALLGQPQILTVSAMDGGGNPVANLPITFQVFGSNAQTLSGTTSAAGQALFSYVGVFSGTDNIQASAFITGLRVISNLGSVTWSPPVGGGPNPSPNPNPNAPPPPSITAPSPVDGAVVTKPVPISATIAPPAGQTITAWRVLYQAQDPGPIVTLASGSGTPPATLATFDPTLLPNDTYTITIEATASGGGIQDVSTTVAVFGNLKLGRYMTTYQDLSVPVNGFQMEVRRTYDSIDKSSGDFGVGWRVGVSDFRTAPNRILGAAGWTQYNKSCTLGLCFTAFANSAPRYVTVTFPDQHTEVFDFTPQGGTNVFWGCTPQFTARASTGTTSTLEPVDDTSCSYTGDGNLYGSNGLYAPNRFKLTTRSGMVLILDRTLGLISETDSSGNSLTFDSTGVHSSSGPSITFTRDSSNRITKIVGPSGQSLSYSYSVAGDLASVSDPNGNLTTYTYDGNHDLLTVTGPGSTPMETQQYDSSGRLSSIQVGSGPPIAVATNVGAQTQTLTDATGQLVTVNTYDDLGDLVREDRDYGSTSLTSTWTYDSVGRTTSSTDPLGRTLKGTYDSTGNLTSFTNAAGGVTTITYDSAGDPLTVTDPTGAVTTYGYDSVFNLISRTDALGHTETYTRDSNGRVSVYTDKLGQKTTFTYDAAGNVLTKTDPLGNTTTFTYDASNRLLSRTDALGHKTSYTYDSAGDLTSVTDQLGRTVTLTYDALLRLVSRKDAAGNTATYAYTASFPTLLSSVTDPMGHVTSYAYDADGRLTQITDALGGTRSFTYDPLGRIVASTDALGRTTTSAYDAAGQMTSQVWPNGGHASFTYDALGDQTSATDPLGDTLHAVYDGDRRVTSLTNALGQITTITRDAIGQPIKVTDPLGLASTASYDADGQLVTTTNPAGGTTTYTYDAAGNQTGITDPLGRTTTATYDAAHRVTALTDPAGHTQSFTWDAGDQLIAAARASGATTRYQYDATGNETSVTDPLGNVATASYNADGDQTSVTDPLGHVTVYAYDADRRLSAITDALGGSVHFNFDAAGQLTSHTDAAGHTTTFAYDALGNLVTEVSPTSGTQTAQYDLAGRLIGSTDGRGVARSLAYDAGNELTSLSAPGVNFAYAYDANGRPSSMTDSTGTTTYAYDAASRITSIAAPFGTTGYTYDAAGQRTSMTVAAGKTITYGHDSAGNLSSLSDWLGHTFNYTYDADNRLITAAKPNGIVATYTYDADNRLTSINDANGGSTVARFAYTYSATGNRTSATSGSSTDTYSFDALNRLTAVAYGKGGAAAYTYDAAGNRLNQTINGVKSSDTYNSNGQLTSDGTNSYAYDASGNLVSAGASTFTYNSLDEMSGASVGGVNSTYTYDGAGLRVAATLASGSTLGSSTTQYEYDRARQLPVVVSDGANQYLRDGGLAEVVNSATAAYPLTDALGSIRDITDAAGSLTATQSYDAFGAVTATSGAVGAFGFTGAQTDSTGLTYLRARYLNPVTGQFTAPDSVQPNAPGTQGFNPYSYTANNPVSYTDPSGRCTSTPSNPSDEPTSPDSADGGTGEGAPPSSDVPAEEPQASAPSDYVEDPTAVGDGVDAPRAPMTDAPDVPKAPGAFPGDSPEPSVPSGEAGGNPFGGAMFEYLSLLSISQEVFGSLMGLGQAVKKALNRVATSILKLGGADPLIEPSGDVQFMGAWSTNPPLGGGGTLFVDNARLLPGDPAGDCPVDGSPNGPAENAAATPADEGLSAPEEVGAAGAARVLQGQAGVDRAIADLEAAGGRVLGREITLDVNGVRTRPDLFVRLPNGQQTFLEVKTGPQAALTRNQGLAYPGIRSGGAVPAGQNAAEAGLTPGQPLGPIPVWVVRIPWPLGV